MNFGDDAEKPKSWKEIWGSGQGIGVIDDVVTTAALVDRLESEFADAQLRLQKTLSDFR